MKRTMRTNARADALVTIAVSVVVVSLLYIGVQGIFNEELGAGLIQMTSPVVRVLVKK